MAEMTLTKEELEELVASLETRTWKYGLNGSWPVWTICRRAYIAETRGKRTCFYRRHFLYTQDAADELEIGYIDWIDASKSGQMVLTDDGIVCEVLKLRTTQRDDSLELAFGRKWRYVRKDGGTSPLYALKYMYAGWYGSSVPKTKKQGFADRGCIKKGMDLFARIMAFRGGFVTDEDCRLVCNIMWPTRYSGRNPIHHPRAYLFGFFSRNEFARKKTMSILSKIMTERGLSAQTGVDMLADAFRVARGKENARQMKEIAQYVLEVHERESGPNEKDFQDLSVYDAVDMSMVDMGELKPVTEIPTDLRLEGLFSGHGAHKSDTSEENKGK